MGLLFCPLNFDWVFVTFWILVCCWTDCDTNVIWMLKLANVWVCNLNMHGFDYSWFVDVFIGEKCDVGCVLVIIIHYWSWWCARVQRSIGGSKWRMVFHCNLVTKRWRAEPCQVWNILETFHEWSEWSEKVKTEVL